jgi:hypothetical protein
MLGRLTKLGATTALALFTLGAHAAISTFSTDTEGWTALGDSQGPLMWSATGGNPGGHVFIDDLTTGGVTYFDAPAKFLGDQSGALGTFLTFDLRQVFSGSPSQFDDEDVVLQGAGLTLVYDTSPNPANGAWTSYSVPLSSGAWRVNTLVGSLATAEQFASVLGDLTALQIRAEYRSGPDIGSLDNVILVPEPGSYLLMLAGLILVLLLPRLRSNRA